MILLGSRYKNPAEDLYDILRRPALRDKCVSAWSTVPEWRFSKNAMSAAKGRMMEHLAEAAE